LTDGDGGQSDRFVHFAVFRTNRDISYSGDGKLKAGGAVFLGIMSVGFVALAAGLAGLALVLARFATVVTGRAAVMVGLAPVF
jgi:hypothetical protein